MIEEDDIREECMHNKEKKLRIFSIIMCWVPFVSMLISDTLNLNNNIKNVIRLIILLLYIVIIIIAIKISKNIKIGEKIFAIIGLTLVIGYTIYFVLEKFK